MGHHNKSGLSGELIYPQIPYAGIEELVIDLDNGPSLNSHRTQFIKRMGQFVQATKLKVHLVYYPPYHSKYNPIERCWAALENYWNGTILTVIDDALGWAANMTWNGVSPLVNLVNGDYPKKIKVSADELEPYKQQWQRSNSLPNGMSPLHRPKPYLILLAVPLFGCLKTRGFCLESTHLQDPERLSRMLALLSIALCWAFRVGEWTNQHKPIVIKKHGRPARSIFRVGFDRLRKILINLTETPNSDFIDVLNFLSCT